MTPVLMEVLITCLTAMVKTRFGSCLWRDNTVIYPWDK